MKPLSTAIGIISLMLASACLLPAQAIQINRENKTIAISTTDEATATADIAAITVGYDIYGPDSQSVTADGGKISHAILEALHKAGVDDASIESSGQGVERNRDFDEKDKPEQRAKNQFKLHQSWVVSVAPQQASAVIHMTIAVGANSSGNIDWRLSDRKTLQAKAAEAALVKARAVAEKMAEGLHVKLGSLIYASNESPKAMIYFRPKPGLTMYTESASLASVVVTPGLEIRPQIIHEEATVYAVFAIE